MRAAGMSASTKKLIAALKAAKKLSSEGSDEVRAAITSGADIHVRARNGATPLMIASSRGLYRPAKLLIEAGAEVNAFASRSGYVIHYAAIGNCPAIIRLLAAHGAPLEQTDIINGYTPLQNAVLFEKRASVRTLIALGADVDGHTAETMSPLAFASWADNPYLMKTLIAAGADINQKGKDGRPLLTSALISNKLRAAEALVRAGADCDAVSDGRLTPLIFMVSNNKYAPLVRLIIKNGYAVSKKQKTGVNLLSQAVSNSADKIVRLLVRSEYNINTKFGGITALHAAVLNHNAAMVHLLLELGATPDTRDFGGYTSLMTAVNRQDAETAQMLLRYGADPNKKDTDGSPVLRHALLQRSPALVQLLIDYGADSNAKDETGKTPLIEAATDKQFAIVRLLVDHGARLDETDPQSGFTALAAALAGNDARTARFLMRSGARDIPAKKLRANMVMMAAVTDKSDIARHYLAAGTDANAVCVQGFTALIIAAQSNALRTAAVLLKAGADPDASDNSGATALSYAAARHFTEMETLLRTYGAHRTPKITLHKPDTGDPLMKMKSASQLLVEEKRQ